MKFKTTNTLAALLLMAVVFLLAAGIYLSLVAGVALLLSIGINMCFGIEISTLGICLLIIAINGAYLIFGGKR